MHKLTQLFKTHHERVFANHGATAKGVDWNDEDELAFRYGKMLDVLARDGRTPGGVPSVLDVGCGWGGLLQFARARGVELDYTGIDVVESMVENARARFPDATFTLGDVLEEQGEGRYDYVICNAILTQRLTASIIEMEAFSNAMLRKMFELCRYGMVTNFISTRVNYMVENLYYRNPADTLGWCLLELSPKVKLDHGYSSLKTGQGKFYDFTLYVYKD
jgi:SAM-dependent methyltransferase